MSYAEKTKLEAMLLGVPDFPSISLNINHHEINLMKQMLCHVTLQKEGSPKLYLYESQVIVLGLQLDGRIGMSLDESASVIESQSIAAFKLLKCNCEAHQLLKEETERDLDFGILLSQLEKFDVRKKYQMDQIAGADCVTQLLNFLMRRQNLLVRCHSNGANLQVRLLMYDCSKKTVELVKPPPNFMVSSSSNEAAAVDKIASSQCYVKMIAAGLGHVSSPLIRYLLGMTISETVSLFLIENSLKSEAVQGVKYAGDIKVKVVTTESYNFSSADKLEGLLKKMAAAFLYLLRDYEERVKVYYSGPGETEANSLANSDQLIQAKKRRKMRDEPEDEPEQN